MAKSMSPHDIMNLMGKAANKKAQQAGQHQQPNDEEDPLNSSTPKAKSAPQSSKSKQTAAINAKEKGKARMIPNKKAENV